MTNKPNSGSCLILACGNTLRSDDGVGPWLAAWAEECFSAEPEIHIICRQQWTPELAEEVARAEAVIFVDSAVDTPPGTVRIARVQPARVESAPATHHVGAAELLALGQELYGSQPAHAFQLTIGAGSMEMGQTFSKSVKNALPEACHILESTVRNSLHQSKFEPIQVVQSHPRLLF